MNKAGRGNRILASHDISQVVGISPNDSLSRLLGSLPVTSDVGQGFLGVHPPHHLELLVATASQACNFTIFL